MSELFDKQWPVVIKGNVFINCISALFGILFLVIGGFIFVFGVHGLSQHEAGDVLIFTFFMGVIFFYIAFRFLYESIGTTVNFRIAADEKGLCLLIRGRYVSIPNEDITSIWAGEPSYQGASGQIGTRLVIILKKEFLPFRSPVSNYFFQVSGHKIRYSQYALGVSPSDAQDLLKTYWKGRD